MASPAKNPRNRRERVERRSEEREGYRGPERRQGARRRADLRRPLWQQPFAVLFAAGLGVLGALGFDELQSADPLPRAVDAPAVSDSTSTLPDAAPSVDPEQLAAAQTMRDEAERLTLAAVTIDETAHERWLPRIARIEAVRSDPGTPEALRIELDATLVALAEVGVL